MGQQFYNHFFFKSLHMSVIHVVTNMSQIVSQKDRVNFSGFNKLKYADPQVWLLKLWVLLHVYEKFKNGS